MDNYNDVGYMNVPSDDECLVSAVHISKVIKEPPHTIRSWADEFEDFLYIKKINGRFSYTNKSIEQFEFIKKLRRDKNFSIKQIREQLKIKGFHYEDNENGLINTDDVNLMESIKIDIGIEVKNQFKDFLIEFSNYQKERDLEQLEKHDMKLEMIIDEHNQMSEENLKKYIDEKINNQEDIIKYGFNKAEQRDIDLVENLRDTLKDEKIKALELKIEELELNQQPKSFISKIFNFKK